MANQTILITGASSGLGLAFIRHYASLPSPPHIIALDICPFPSTQFPTTNLAFNQVDITSPTFSSRVPPSTPIHLIIHCAGVRGLVPEIVKSQPGDVSAAETIKVMNHTTMMKTFEINTWGTFNLVKCLLPNLRLAASSTESPKVVIMSSRMGSIAANTGGGAYAYRASKAALNAIIQSLVIDEPDVTFLLLHPGRVETGLVEWKEEGAMTVEESLVDCLKVIDATKKGESGKFVDRFGVRIAW